MRRINVKNGFLNLIITYLHSFRVSHLHSSRGNCRSTLTHISFSGIGFMSRSHSTLGISFGTCRHSSANALIVTSWQTSRVSGLGVYVHILSLGSSIRSRRQSSSGTSRDFTSQSTINQNICNTVIKNMKNINITWETSNIIPCLVTSLHSSLTFWTGIPSMHICSGTSLGICLQFRLPAILVQFSRGM